ncbi:MAG: LysM peptidoglycan-binding domain-containing protein [Planctomycetota bacterium]
MSRYSLWNPFMVVLDPRTFKGDEPSSGGEDNDSGSTTTTTTTTGGGRYEDSRADLEAQGYTVSDDGNSVYSDTGQVAGANWSQGSIDAIVDDDDGGQQSSSQTIQSGDTVSQIALDNNTTIEDIKALNPGIDINNIQVGQEINLTPDSRDEGESIYTGATQAELDAGNVMKVASTEEIMSEYEKLQAAGEEDTSVLDEIAAADTTGIDVYEPTPETVTAVEDYYTTGAGATGATQDVDYTQTSSGEDFVAAAESDTSDIVGGTDFTTYEGETVEVRELPSGTKYYVDMSGNYVALAPEEDVTVDTFSASEITTPVSEIAGPFDGTQTYEETILEPGTGGISGIRLGDPMTQQLATELGVNYFEGDTIQSDDLIRLSDLGFDVSQADLTQARSEVPLDVDVTVTTADQGSMADMQNYIEQLNQQVGGATFADLEAAGFDVDLIKQYNDTVGSIPGMPVEGTMLYSSLYGGDGGVYTGDEVATDTTDILDYEDYITQGGQNPLGGGGLPDDFFEQPTSDVINLNGQLYGTVSCMLLVMRTGPLIQGSRMRFVVLRWMDIRHLRRLRTSPRRRLLRSSSLWVCLLRVLRDRGIRLLKQLLRLRRIRVTRLSS